MLWFHKLGSTEACGLQSLRLHLTFNKPGYSHVATADYSEAAGDKGGREVCLIAQANREMGSNKAGLLTDLSLADCVSL